MNASGGFFDPRRPSGSLLDGLYVPHPGRPEGICDGVEGVRRKVREVRHAGADIIKGAASGSLKNLADEFFDQFTFEELVAMVEEGQNRGGIKVMAHAMAAEGIKRTVLACVHSIEHGNFLDEEGIELMLERGTYLVPTLFAFHYIWKQALEDGNPTGWDSLNHLQETVDIHQENIAAAHEAGVPVAMGTDEGAGVPHHGWNLQELGFMCDAGLKPMAAIKAATKTAAGCLEWGDEVGTVEAGKLADIVISRTDPVADIRSLADTDNIMIVMQDGQIVKDRREVEV